MMPLIAVLTFLPILGWIYFFQKVHHESKKYIFLAFLAGMISVVPIKIYEKYWHSSVAFFENINLFQHISDLVGAPSTAKLLAFISVNALVAFLLFAFTSILMFFLEVFSGDNSIKIFEKKFLRICESPLFFLIVGIFSGILAFFLNLNLHEKVWFFVIVGMLEEYIKHLVLRFSDEEKIFSVQDAISFSIVVALGFAFVENILYFQKFLKTGNFVISQFSIFFILRSLISVAAHIFFSAIFGYFYGVAHFSNDEFKKNHRENRHPIISFLHKILHVKSATLFHEEKMMEGMLAAVILHAIFNSFLEFGQIILILFFLFSGIFLILHLLHEEKTFHFQNFSEKNILKLKKSCKNF